MKIGGMGGFELVIILIVVLLIFGPKNLPKLGSALGKTVSNLRSGMNDGKKKDGEAAAADDVPTDAQIDLKLAEIEGEVESVEDIDKTEEAEESVDAEKADPVVADADGTSAAEASFEAPKKVRRVVKKKVASGE